MCGFVTLCVRWNWELRTRLSFLCGFEWRLLHLSGRQPAVRAAPDPSASFQHPAQLIPSWRDNRASLTFDQRHRHRKITAENSTWKKSGYLQRTDHRSCILETGWWSVFSPSTYQENQILIHFEKMFYRLSCILKILIWLWK